MQREQRGHAGEEAVGGLLLLSSLEPAPREETAAYEGCALSTTTHVPGAGPEDLRCASVTPLLRAEVSMESVHLLAWPCVNAVAPHQPRGVLEAIGVER